MNMPDRLYITIRTDQVDAAIRAHDGALAGDIIRGIAADGYPVFAEHLLDELVERGLQNMIAKAGVQ